MNEGQRRLGNTGLFVSQVGVGCNNFGGRMDEAAAKRVVDAALDHGITLFDTADVYGEQKSEVYLGNALKGRRDQAVIATKFGSPMGEGPLWRGGSRRYVPVKRSGVPDHARFPRHHLARVYLLGHL